MDYKRALRQMKFMEKNSDKMRLAAQGWDRDWKTLVATIMSAQVRDEVTVPVAEKLFEKYSSLKKLSEAKIGDVEKVLRSLNFYRSKSRNIVNCAKMIIGDFGGRVPMDEELLVRLPGVGKKTAGVLFSEIGRAGIGVDTHVFQISRALGWSNSKTPDKVQADLKRMFPKRYWSRINPILVRFGKTYVSRKKKDEMLEVVRSIS